MTDIVRPALFQKVPFAIFAAVSIAVLALGLDHITQAEMFDLYVLHAAGRAVLAGINPYTLPDKLNFYTPAWSLVLLAPLSLVPFRIVAIGWVLATYITWIAVLRAYRTDWLGCALFLVNPFFIYGLALGSYDWLALLGLFLPMQAGVWFLLLKPQLSVGLLAWHTQRVGIWQAVRDYWLAGIVFAGSLLLGFYRADVLDVPWNLSLGWFGVPIGLLMVWQSFTRGDSMYALAAAPFLSPYVAIQTWALPLLLLTRDRRILAVGVIVSWVYIIATK